MPYELQKFLQGMSGKWIAMGGNRWIGSQTKKRIELITKQVIKTNAKIVTGGAEGADHVVLKACLKYKIPKSNLKVFLPYTIRDEYKHCTKLEGARKARALEQTLLEIRTAYPKAVVEHRDRFKTYRYAADFRNRLIEKQAEAMIIFKAKGSRGSLDAVKAAKVRKLPLLIF